MCFNLALVVPIMIQYLAGPDKTKTMFDRIKAVSGRIKGILGRIIVVFDKTVAGAKQNLAELTVLGKIK